MTTIAYRDGILACDNMVVEGRTAFKGNKKLQIKSFNNRVVRAIAVSGNLVIGSMFMDWFFEQVSKEDNHEGLHIPSNYDHQEFNALVITKRPSSEFIVDFWDEALYSLDESDRPFNAIGSGKDVALGAMQVGADAKEAVTAACNICTETGFGISFVDLNEYVPKIETKNVRDIS